MNAQRLWQIAGAIVILGILGLGWLLLVSPGLEQVKTTDQQRQTVQATNARIQREIDNLSEVDVEALRGSLGTRITQIPSKLVEEHVFDEIKNAGLATGVAVTSISISQPSAFSTTQVSAEDTETPTPEQTEAGAPIVSPGLPITADDLAVALDADLYVSRVTINLDGAFPNARAFINTLTKTASRNFLVTGASLNGEGGQATINAIIWFKPRAVDLLTDPEPAS